MYNLNMERGEIMSKSKRIEDLEKITKKKMYSCLGLKEGITTREIF